MLKLVVESTSGASYMLQMNKPFGLYHFWHKAADGTSILCAKEIG